MMAVKNALALLRTWDGHEETTRAVEKALNLFQQTKNEKDKISPEVLEQLGSGWVAEEALAISLYASLIYENDFEKGVLLAVNHSGDSDSTGSITGNILGLINGYESIPLKWQQNLVGQEIVKQVGEDLFI